MFSDGVSDNVFDDTIMGCIPNFTADQQINLYSAANCIANEAYDLGKSEDYKSPFHINAIAQEVDFPAEGKHDDIAVIVA